MTSTPTIMEAYEALDTQAPDCTECEDGVLHYCDGPYAMTRECETCHGTGRYMECPRCIEGFIGDTECLTCDGVGALH